MSNLLKFIYTIGEVFDRLKDLDYREMLKMRIDPKDLHFFIKPAKFEHFFKGPKFHDIVYKLLDYSLVRLISDVTLKRCVYMLEYLSVLLCDMYTYFNLNHDVVSCFC